MSSAISTTNLTKQFGKRVVVDHLDLQVERGEVFGFLGPNGAGKTTTISMLLGLVRPSAGSATVLGHDIGRDPAAALRSVGAMVEAPAFYPYLSGRNNLRVLARAAGLPDTAVEAALDAVELQRHAGGRFKTYSQGMRQRLGIAATLLHNPELIILDEPTNGLDPAGQQEIRTLIGTLAQRGHTIFFCSHILHDVEQICRRVAILKEGALVAQGEVAELLRGGRGILVRSDDKAPALLAALPWVRGVQPHGDALLVEAPAERAADLNAHLVSNGSPVHELRPFERSLEQFFLDVTGR